MMGALLTLPDDMVYEEAMKAMMNGDEVSKRKVALFKLSGHGGAEIDLKGAVELLEDHLKNDEEDGEAMWMLGLCCEYGMGTEQDIERAELLYSHSCALDNEVGWFLAKNTFHKRGCGLFKADSLCFMLLVSSMLNNNIMFVSLFEQLCVLL